MSLFMHLLIFYLFIYLFIYFLHRGRASSRDNRLIKRVICTVRAGGSQQPAVHPGVQTKQAAKGARCSADENIHETTPLVVRKMD